MIVCCAMMWLWVCVCALWLCVLAVAANETPGDGCRVEDIAVVDDFNYEKFLGTWYEYRWQWPGSFPIEDIYRDYTRTFTRTSDPHKLRVLINARENNVTHASDAVCLRYEVSLVLDANFTAKMRYNKASDGETEDIVDFWILAIDYDNYALSYTCMNVTDQGTCDSSGGSVESTIWTREPEAISDAHLNLMTQTLTDVCVDSDSLVQLEQMGFCPKQQPSNGAVRQQAAAVMHIMPLIVLIIHSMHSA